MKRVPLDPDTALGDRENGSVVTVVAEPSLREMAQRVHEFEGVRCLWRVPVALATYALIRGVPIAAAIVVALVAVNGRVLEAALSATIALLFDGLAKTARARLPWRAVVGNRLWSFEKPNPPTEVPVLLASADASSARTALRRARFNPQVHGLHLGTPPSDAPDLDYKIAVHEPAAWSQAVSDNDRTRRIVGVFEGADLRARVGGVDVRPDKGPTLERPSRVAR